jgi:ABC-2 type transport system ATP-binding protein
MAREGLLSDDALVVDGLHLQRGRRQVLRGVTFCARPGRVTVLVGMNGAGKTTTLHAVLGLLRCDRGEVRVWGRSLSDFGMPARYVGYAPDVLRAFPRHTARDHLTMVAARAGVGARRITSVLHEVGLGERADQPVRGYSLGMRRRLSLAMALLGDPPLLVLDEPTNGLDPQAQRWLRGTLRARADAGDAVVVSSHDLAALDGFADDLVLLDRGSVVLCRSLRQLRRRAETRLVIEAEDRSALAGLLQRLGLRVDGVDGRGFVTSGVPAITVARAAMDARIVLTRVVPVTLPLEDLILDSLDDPGEPLPPSTGVAASPPVDGRVDDHRVDLRESPPRSSP